MIPLSLPAPFDHLAGAELSAELHVAQLLKHAAADLVFVRALAEFQDHRQPTQAAVARAMDGGLALKHIRIKTADGDCRVDLQVNHVRQGGVRTHSVFLHIPISALADGDTFAAWRKREITKMEANSRQWLVCDELRARAHLRRMKFLRKDTCAKIIAEADAAQNKTGGAR